MAAIENVASGLAEVRARGAGFPFGGGRVGRTREPRGQRLSQDLRFRGLHAPTDQRLQLTARINDEGWDSCFANWLKGSHLAQKDAVLVFSVGGGNRENNVSVNLVQALELAQETGAPILGIVGKDGGFTRQASQACVLIPVVSPDRITPHTEGFCAVIWHLLVSHPKLAANPTKWESVVAAKP